MTNVVKIVLARVLTQRVYLLDPKLVRNDSKTARLVKALSEKMADDYEREAKKVAYLGGKVNKAAQREFEDTYGYLYNLDEETIRKYTRELWQDEAFAKQLRFEESEEWSNSQFGKNVIF